MDVVAGRWGSAHIFFRLFMLVNIIVENANETLSDPSFCCACMSELGGDTLRNANPVDQKCQSVRSKAAHIPRQQAVNQIDCNWIR